MISHTALLRSDVVANTESAATVRDEHIAPTAALVSW